MRSTGCGVAPNSPSSIGCAPEEPFAPCGVAQGPCSALPRRGNDGRRCDALTARSFFHLSAPSSDFSSRRRPSRRVRRSIATLGARSTALPRTSTSRAVFFGRRPRSKSSGALRRSALTRSGTPPLSPPTMSPSEPSPAHAARHGPRASSPAATTPPHLLAVRSSSRRRGSSARDGRSASRAATAAVVRHSSRFSRLQAHRVTTVTLDPWRVP